MSKDKSSGGKMSFLASIKSKIMMLLVACVIVSVAVVMVITLPQMRSTLKDLSMNYMYDVTMTLGDEMELVKENTSTDELLSLDTLTDLCAGVGIKGVDSSYAYVVAEDTTMLYHPTESKIGLPVENSVVLQVCGDLQDGKSVDNAVVEYYFNGSMRYAAYYVDPDSEFVLIISAEVTDVMAPINKLLITGIVCGIIIIILCIIAGFFVASRMMKPFDDMTGVVMKLVDMDFTEDEVQRRLDGRKDETGKMSRAITALRGQLAEMVRILSEQSGKLFKVSDSLNSNAGETASSVGLVERAVNEIAEGASSQASDTQRATEAVIEIGEMMEQTSVIMNKLTANATEMKESSDEASESLSQLDQINKRARQAIDVIYEQTNTTNESAQKIREATSLISSIAEETNLLSLNASIEAARAGEQGRGFAVVATQIQKLAEQSSASAQKIETITDSLIEDSEKAVHTMADVQDIMAQQSEHVTKTDEIFGRVKEGIDSSINGISAMADSSQKMDEARASVVDVVQNLTSIAQENAASTQETTASVTEVGNIVGQISDNAAAMKGVADELEQSMSMFKL